jgi:hypothetical protein
LFDAAKSFDRNIRQKKMSHMVKHPFQIVRKIIYRFLNCLTSMIGKTIGGNMAAETTELIAARINGKII